MVRNGDGALLDTVAVPFRTVRCGKSEHCQARITEISDHGVEGIRCTVATEKDRYPLDIPAPGEHMAYAAAIAVVLIAITLAVDLVSWRLAGRGRR